MKTMNRIFAAILALVLVCACIPALAEKNPNVILGADKLMYDYHQHERRVTLHYYPQYKTEISYSIAGAVGEIEGKEIKLVGDVVIIPGGYVGAFHLLVTAKETLGHAETVKDVPFMVYPDLPKLAVKTVEKDSIDLMWKAVPGANFYSVVYSVDPSLNNCNEIVVKGTTATIKNLKQGTKYYVAIAAGFTDTQWSVRGNYTEPVCVTTKSEKVAPKCKYFDLIDNKLCAIILNGQTITMKSGSTKQLKAVRFKPASTKQRVIFKSSNKSVVSVSSNGLLKACCIGKAKIAVRTVDGGYTTTLIVKVVK